MKQQKKKSGRVVCREAIQKKDCYIECSPTGMDSLFISPVVLRSLFKFYVL